LRGATKWGRARMEPRWNPELIFEKRKPPLGAVCAERETGFEPATSSLGS
jgi:hypothetical protein